MKPRNSNTDRYKNESRWLLLHTPPLSHSGQRRGLLRHHTVRSTTSHTLLPFQSNWTDTHNMSSEAAGHKTGGEKKRKKKNRAFTFLLWPRWERTHTHTHDKTLTKQGKEKSTKSNLKKYKNRASCIEALCINVTIINYKKITNVQVFHSLALKADGMWFPIGILAELFHFSHLSKHFST